MKRVLVAALLVASCFFLLACGQYYDENDLKEARQEARSEGYYNGYTEGEEAVQEHPDDYGLYDWNEVREMLADEYYYGYDDGYDDGWYGYEYNPEY